MKANKYSELYSRCCIIEHYYYRKQNIAGFRQHVSVSGLHPDMSTGLIW